MRHLPWHRGLCGCASPAPLAAHGGVGGADQAGREDRAGWLDAHNRQRLLQFSRWPCTGRSPRTPRAQGPHSHFLCPPPVSSREREREAGSGGRPGVQEAESAGLAPCDLATGSSWTSAGPDLLGGSAGGGRGNHSQPCISPFRDSEVTRDSRRTQWERC